MTKERVDSDRINYLIWRYVVLSALAVLPRDVCWAWVVVVVVLAGTRDRLLTGGCSIHRYLVESGTCTTTITICVQLVGRN